MNVINNDILTNFIENFFFDNAKLPKSKKIYYENCKNIGLDNFEDNIYIVITKDSIHREKKMRMERSIFFFILENREKFKCFENKQNSLKKIIKESHQSLYKKIIKIQPELFVRNYIFFVSIFPTDSGCNYYYNKVNTKYEFDKNKNPIYSNTSETLVVQDITMEIETMKAEKAEFLSCLDAYNGELTFYDETKLNYTRICEKIKNGCQTLLVEGPARSGKTIIAMRLLNEYKNLKLLLMNYHFYEELTNVFEANGYTMPKDRIFHHDPNYEGNWLKNLNCTSLVIDEAQRLSTEQIDIILKYPNRQLTIFLGDSLQRLNPSYDVGFNSISNIIKNENINFERMQFDSAIGISPEIVNSILYLLGNNDYLVSKLPETYNISICSSYEKFVDKFNKSSGIKHYVVPTIKRYRYEFKVGGQIVKSAPKKFDVPYFNNTQIRDVYMLDTYKVISRELQNVFLYVHNEISYSRTEGIYSTVNKHFNQYVLFHLYVLMTRATHNLVIYCEDKNLELYFKKRLNDIKKAKISDNKIMFHKLYGYGYIVDEDKNYYRVSFAEGEVREFTKFHKSFKIIEI